MPSKIWCEVTCGKCTRAALSSGYYSPERIKKLKVETKDWKHDDCYRMLCPECFKEVTANRTRRTEKESRRSDSIDFQREEVEFSLEDSFF